MCIFAGGNITLDETICFESDKIFKNQLVYCLINLKLNKTSYKNIEIKVESTFMVDDKMLLLSNANDIACKHIFSPNIWEMLDLKIDIDRQIYVVSSLTIWFQKQ